MKWTSFAYGLLFACGTVWSQSPDYWFDPDTVVDAQLPLDSTVLVVQADYGDASAVDSVVWAWKRVEWSAPEGWTVDACDPTVCHTGVPSSATQLPLAADAPSFLKFLISSRGIPGQASGTFWVFPQGQIDQHLTLHFTFTAGPLATLPAPGPPAYRIHPNPTTGPLEWRDPAAIAGTWTLHTLTGRLIETGRFPAAPDLTPRPPGTYLLKPGDGQPALLVLKTDTP
jgi:hypothetical protein